MNNPCIFQFFHWHYPAKGSLWREVSDRARLLSELGITHVWLPPAYKSAEGANGVGYAAYDLFDLGEFDQKGSVRTKYGTKDEFISCIQSLHENNLQVLADVVLNHKQGADLKERVPVRKVNPENRNEFIGEPEEVELYTKYSFPNRASKYSEYVWDWRSFSGIDQQKDKDYVIYKILNDSGEKWDDVIEDELGNFAYLMGADIELRNPYVRDELKRWGKWFVEISGVDGFRFDAVKHMSTSFMKDWIDYIRSEFHREFFCISEYWSGNAEVLAKYIDELEGRTHLMDVSLHANFHEAGKRGEFDLRNLFKESLIEKKPERTISFVDNHDTQPTQTLESPVADWFKPHAYAAVLFRQQGIPCVFYPDLFEASYEQKGQKVNMKKVSRIKKMLRARQYLAYGEQKDYFNDAQCIGWARTGLEEKNLSGLAVILNTSNDKRRLEMQLGVNHANKSFIDLTGGTKKIIQTDENGNAVFFAKPAQMALWIREEALEFF